MKLWQKLTNLLVEKKLKFGKGAVIEYVSSTSNTPATINFAELTLLDGATFTVNEANYMLDGIAYTASVASSALSAGSAAMQFVFTDRAGTAITYNLKGRGHISTTASGTTYGNVSGITAVTNGAIHNITSGSFDFITTVSGRLGVNIVNSASSNFVTFEMPNGKIAASTVITTS